MFGIETGDLVVLGVLGLGMGEIVVIGVVGLLVFGNRLPQTMRSLGQSVVQFKKGLRETQDEMERAIEEGEKKLDAKPAPKAELAKIEPAKTEPAKAEPAHTEPAKFEVKTEAKDLEKK